MNTEELKKILELHNLFLRGDSMGKMADLRGASLEGADLEWADLEWAKLEGANLEGANLEGADLEGADLEGANLEGANLEGANLEGANLEGANLRRAKLEWANLRGAKLEWANLRGVNLRGANLRGANLEGTDLRGAKLPHFMICPSEGEFIAYKKVKSLSGDSYVIKLKIIGERTSSLVGRKCRTNKAIVIDRGGASSTDTLVSIHDDTFEYPEGIVLYEPKYDPDIRVECTGGIHFFVTRQEAEEY